MQIQVMKLMNSNICQDQGNNYKSETSPLSKGQTITGILEEYFFILQLLPFIFHMHSKIYKAKLINIHNQRQNEEEVEFMRHTPSIHAYYGMLQHVFQRNKHMVRQLKLSGFHIQKRLASRDKSENIKQEPSGNIRKRAVSQKRQKSYSHSKCKKMNTEINQKQVKVESVAKAQNNPERALNCFIPIGLALQSKKKMNFYSHRVGNATSIMDSVRETGQCKGGMITERLLSITQKKPTLRTKHSLFKLKSEGCEDTNHSSIRTTHKSNAQSHHHSSQDSSSFPGVVAPW